MGGGGSDSFECVRQSGNSIYNKKLNDIQNKKYQKSIIHKL